MQSIGAPTCTTKRYRAPWTPIFDQKMHFLKIASKWIARLASVFVKSAPIWVAMPQPGLILYQIEANGLNNTSICLRTLFSIRFH